MQQKKTVTFCNYCRFWTGYSCMTTPSQNNCAKAKDEYYYDKYNGNKYKQQPQKSLRKWDRN